MSPFGGKFKAADHLAFLTLLTFIEIFAYSWLVIKNFLFPDYQSFTLFSKHLVWKNMGHFILMCHLSRSSEFLRIQHNFDFPMELFN
jgi:hypothetical protein